MIKPPFMRFFLFLFLLFLTPLPLEAQWRDAPPPADFYEYDFHSFDGTYMGFYYAQQRIHGDEYAGGGVLTLGARRGFLRVESEWHIAEGKSILPPDAPNRPQIQGAIKTSEVAHAFYVNFYAEGMPAQIKSPIQPYIGGGVGFAYYRLAPYNEGRVNCRIVNYPRVTCVDGRLDDANVHRIYSLATNGSVGAALHITENFALDVAYRYHYLTRDELSSWHEAVIGFRLYP